jgi:uncharacterized protein YgiM (DUF1202 family)
MIRVPSFLCISFIILFSAQNQATAQETAATYRVKGTVSEGILNMRDGPGQRYKIVVILVAGEGDIRVKTCRSADDDISQFPWCLVEVGPYKPGWVSQAGLERAPSTATAQFPIIFNKEAEMEPIGLTYLDRTEGPRRHLAHRCYYIGDGGPGISFSDAFLDHYKALGFSRRSLCMALMSGVRFNPETGNRLATYIRKFSENDYDMYPELPITVPACFKNGTPYSDCIFRYHPLSGAALSAEVTRLYRETGERLLQELRDPVRRKSFKYFNDDDTYTKGMIVIGVEQERLNGGPLSVASFYDYSSEFPEGFGYGLYADGTAAPGISAAAVRTAADPRRRRPQISQARVRELLSHN